MIAYFTLIIKFLVITFLIIMFFTEPVYSNQKQAMCDIKIKMLTSDQG